MPVFDLALDLRRHEQVRGVGRVGKGGQAGRAGRGRAVLDRHGLHVVAATVVFGAIAARQVSLDCQSPAGGKSGHTTGESSRRI